MEATRLTWGAALTAVAVISTWIATGPEGPVGQVYHVCGDSIASLFSQPQEITYEWLSTTFDSSHPPHPENCSTCLFAIGDNQTPILVGQKLPHTNYSQFKLLLLPKDPYTTTVGQSKLEGHFIKFLWSHFGKISAIVIVPIIAIFPIITILPIIAVIALRISSHTLETLLSPAIEGSTTPDPSLSINGDDKSPGIDATQHDTSKSTMWKRFAALLNLEQHPNNKELENSHAADPETVAGEHRAFDEDEFGTASMDGDKALKADHEQSVLDLDKNIEQSLTDAAMLQRKLAVIKDQDIEIESLRDKLAFATGKFRECRKELEDCRAERRIENQSSP